MNEIEKLNAIIDGYQPRLQRYKDILQEIKAIAEKYDAEVGDTIIANPIQDCYDIYCLITKAEEE